MEINFKRGLTNSQSYRNIDDTLKEIKFEKRFTNACKDNSKLDLKYLIEDICTHYRNRVSQDFDESFWDVLE